MKIESTIKRKGGTVVTFGATKYHFKPDATGAHVADVDDEAHAARLLEIKEGYRPAKKAAESTTPAVPDSPNGTQVLQGDGGSGEAGVPGGAPAEPNKEPTAKPKRAYAPRKAKAK